MAGSFMERFRERMEQLQAELQPEAAGFDRRAYGYDDEPEAEDATFEDVEREEESPWRRPASDEASSSPQPGPAAGSRGAAARGPAAPGPTEGRPPRASTRPVTRAARAEAFDPFGVGGRQPGGRARREVPPAAPWEAPAAGRSPTSPAAGVRSTPHELDRRAGRGTSRARRLRARLRQPESLRELFLLREAIDRPIALRRPRLRTRPPS